MTELPDMLKLLRTMEHLRGVKEPLKILWARACQRHFIETGHLAVVTSGRRTQKEQQDLYSRGLSWTLNSAHLQGDAIDVALFLNGDELTWGFEHYAAFAACMKDIANEMGIQILWGGDWKQRDATHFQLN